MAEAIPFISFDRWVADCPNPLCHNALEVTPGRPDFACDQPPDGCGQTAAVAWPADVAQRMADLSDRPPAMRSETVPGSPQESLPDQSQATGQDDPVIPEPEDGQP